MSYSARENFFRPLANSRVRGVTSHAESRQLSGGGRKQASDDQDRELEIADRRERRDVPEHAQAEMKAHRQLQEDEQGAEEAGSEQCQ